MDTRHKIITAARAIELARQLRRERVEITVVTGYFDVLLASHIRLLREAASASAKLFVVVCSPGNPILPQGARAELVAALAAVDFVVPIACESDDLLGHIPADRVIRVEEGDRRRTAELIELVHARQAR